MHRHTQRYAVLKESPDQTSRVEHWLPRARQKDARGKDRSASPPPAPTPASICTSSPKLFCCCILKTFRTRRLRSKKKNFTQQLVKSCQMYIYLHTLSGQLMFSFSASRNAPLVHNSMATITWRAEKNESNRRDDEIPYKGGKHQYMRPALKKRSPFM